ncbi:CBS domain-containing protein [Pedobacter steynii]|jgi:acetoin utilization protein AcuB|uniref:CBS domain-containing protein n=2 Tax=Pedobacter TaxID=84567 RepID=A0A1H0I7X3_9SPHI|nr:MULTISPECIES: CBS domain-containing protein [Pedobacter]NQX42822.1 CBS domain-containing protein [Pedobacter steynii]SDO27463.1 CBS domain-containing protein [Pedobacter steynii]SHF83468.1 CBS domain-containing protein [Pedobacter caeni]
MFASELISNSIPPLKTSDSVQKALERMTEFKLYHLPIVNETQFLGLLAEEELIEVRDTEQAIGSLPLSILNPFVYEDAHIYDIIRLFHQLHLSVVPVLDYKKNYLGLISINNLLDYTADIYAVKEPGGIIVLEISNRNNSLSHMAQIVEADNAQILSSYVQSFPDSTKLEVTLKINKTELSGIIASFERYNYQVKAVFNSTISDNGTEDRYNSFMNYLNV